MLARLAHLTNHHRWAVIGAWAVLTLFGAFAAGEVSNRWYQGLAIPGGPAYEASQRTLHAFGAGARAPNVVVFHTAGDATKSRAIDRATRRAAATMPGALVSSYFTTGRRDVRLARPAHHLRRGLSARSGHRRHEERCREDAGRGRGGPAVRDHRERHRPLRARRGERRWLEWRSEPAGGGCHRSAGRARDPAVRLRDAAGRADAGGRRDGCDPQHVHARVGADVRDRRLDHRPVPDRAGRPRRRDRLRAGHDLPLPRRAARRRRRRRGARRDGHPRGALRDRVGLDGRDRTARADRSAAAARPLDGPRRHADPRRLGPRVADAATRAPRRARRAHQQSSRDTAPLRGPRPSRARSLGPLGALRASPPAPGRSGRPCDRHAACGPRNAAEPQRAAAQELPRHRHRDRRPRRCSPTRTSARA